MSRKVSDFELEVVFELHLAMSSISICWSLSGLFPNSRNMLMRQELKFLFWCSELVLILKSSTLLAFYRVIWVGNFIRDNKVVTSLATKWYKSMSICIVWSVLIELSTSKSHAFYLAYKTIMSTIWNKSKTSLINFTLGLESTTQSLSISMSLSRPNQLFGEGGLKKDWLKQF